MPHVHVHLHNGKVTQDAEDAGTSEGAKKAALTRKAGRTQGAVLRKPRFGEAYKEPAKKKSKQLKPRFYQPKFGEARPIKK
jgi:hypothetical protein